MTHLPRRMSAQKENGQKRSGKVKNSVTKRDDSGKDRIDSIVANNNSMRTAINNMRSLMEKQSKEMQILRYVIDTQKDDIQHLKKNVVDKEHILLSSYMDTEKNL